jgi:hypothetical protein
MACVTAAPRIRFQRNSGGPDDEARPGNRIMLQTIRNFRRRSQVQRDMDRATSGRCTPVVIYQMGKVASSTMEATLDKVPGFQVLRTHGLRRYIDTPGEPAERIPLESWMIYHRIIKPGLPVRVVSLVREPIARNISAYFQNLTQIWGMPDAHEKLSSAEIARGFLEKYNHQKPLNWFDDEIKFVLGIDVFQHPFDRDRGAQTVSAPPRELLVLNAEMPDTAKAAELARFLGVDSVALVQKNVGEAKDYSAVYKEFVRTVTLPHDYVDTMLDSRYTRHFFPESRIEQWRRKWKRQD